MKTEQKILQDFDLRKTNSRAAILTLFLKKPFALSYSDLEEQIADDYDRVTVYRTLKTFVDKGVVHKVLDDSGSLKYALCTDLCSSAAHHHEHVHFKCSACGETSCLDQVTIPQVELPVGYEAREINLLIQGKCQKCA
ncbi:MAG: transcriptional repressor [Cyclobacteriaceae bacterium]|nr:transcriptional repressor [Cyclobacteriaceae bacterium]